MPAITTRSSDTLEIDVATLLDGDLLRYNAATGKAEGVECTAFALTILDDANAAAVRSTISAQQQDADLDALAALATTGMISRTGAGAVSARTITAPAAGITVANGDGVAGNPTLSLANDLAALEALAATGLIERTGAETYDQRTLSAYMRGVIDDADAPTARETLGLPPYLNALTPLGGVYLDKAVANTRIYHTIQSLATSDFTLHTRVLVPSANPASISGIAGLSSSATTALAALGVSLRIDTNGALLYTHFGATPATDHRTYTLDTNLVTGWGGKTVTITVTRVAATNAVVIYVNGVAQAATESNGGAPPAWGDSVTSTYLLQGIHEATNILGSTLHRTALFNRALTAAEVQTLNERQVFPWADAWGSMTDIIGHSGPTLNGGFEAAGGGGADVFANWTEVVAGGSTVNDEGAVVHGGAHACRLDIDAGGANAQVGQAILTIGKRYRVSLWAKVNDDAGGPLFSVQDDGGTYAINSQALTTSYVQYSGEFVATHANLNFKRAGGCASKSVYFDDIVVTEIGCLCDPALEDYHEENGTYVHERSGNNFVGAATATGISQVRRRNELIGGVYANGILTGDANVNAARRLCQSATINPAGAGVTLTVQNMRPGETVDMLLTQGAAGGKTVTFSPAPIWDGGVAYVLSAAAGAKDRIQITFDGTNYWGSVVALSAA